MTLDDETRAALGYGETWEQLTLRFGLFVVAERERKTTWQREARRAAGVRPHAEALAAYRHPTDESRREAIRRSKRDYMRRVRAKRAA